jgi:hypothetical protein
LSNSEFFYDAVGAKFINTESMSDARRTDIFDSKCFTESSDDAVLAVSTVYVGEDNIVFFVMGQKFIKLFRYIVNIARMIGLSYEALESFSTSETNGTLGRDATSEESDTHGLLSG